MASSTFDAAVIGAGPAGSAAALHLARNGASVVLIEKQALPRPKTCGGGVVLRALRHLPAGIELPFERVPRFVELRFRGDGLVFRVERERLVSLAMRADLDHALARAATQAGAELACPVALLEMREQAEHVELTTSSGSLRARFVIAADGALGRTAGLAGWKDKLYTIPALEAEVTTSSARLHELSEALVFDFGSIENGYGWIFPKREHLSCGVLSMRRGTHGLRERLDRYLVETNVAPIVALDVQGYVIPVRPRRVRARGRVLLTGDAAGLVDPLTAEGISLALHSGELAAHAVLQARRSPPLARRQYEAMLTREIVRDLRVARLLARLVYGHPRWTSRLFARAGQHFANSLADVVCGERTYRELALDPRNWWRVLAQRERRGAPPRAGNPEAS